MVSRPALPVIVCRYDRKDLSFRKLQDVQFVAAMSPPGGGRNSVTNRYLRHFSVVSVTAFDGETMSTIFNALVDWWMKRTGGDSLPVCACCRAAGSACAYLRCACCEGLQDRRCLPGYASRHRCRT